MLVSDDNVARLDLVFVGGSNDYRYSAPETRFPKNCSESATPVTRERDVYGMGMITYEASSHHPWSLSPG